MEEERSVQTTEVQVEAESKVESKVEEVETRVGESKETRAPTTPAIPPPRIPQAAAPADSTKPMYHTSFLFPGKEFVVFYTRSAAQYAASKETNEVAIQCAVYEVRYLIDRPGCTHSQALEALNNVASLRGMGIQVVYFQVRHLPR